MAHTRGISIHAEGCVSGVSDSIPLTPETIKSSNCDQLLPGPSEAVSFTGRGGLAIGKRGHRGGKGPRLSGVLQPAVPGSKSQWDMAPSNRFKHTEQFSECSTFQNGNGRICSDGSKSIRMGDIPGYGRCVSTYPDVQKPQVLSTLGGERGDIPIPSDAIWTSSYPSPVHQIGKGCQTNASVTGDKGTHLFGRSTGPGIISSTSPAINRHHYGHAVETGVCGQSNQVGTHPNSEIFLCGLRVRLGEGDSVPASKQSVEHCDRGSQTQSIISHDGVSPGLISRAASSNREDGNVGKIVHEGASMVTEDTLAASHAHVHQGPHGSPGGTKLVVQSTQSDRAGTPPPTVPSRGDLHRRLGTWVGSSPGEPDCTGNMVSGSENVTHKLSGNVGSAFSPDKILTYSKGEGYHGWHRQRNRPVAYNESGRYSLKTNVETDLGSPKVVRSSRSHDSSQAHLGRKERDSGLSIPLPSNSRNRVDSRSHRVSKSVCSVGSARDRPICNPVQPATSKVCVSSSRSNGVGSGRDVPSLGRNARVRVPAVGAPKQGSSESRKGKTTSVSNSSLVASTNVAPGLATVVASTSNSAASIPRSVKTNTSRRTSHSSRHAKPARVPDTVVASNRVALKAEISNRISAPQRPSTRKNYDSKVSAFNDWCSRKNIKLNELVIEHVLDFLHDQFLANKAPSTIDGYRAALRDGFPQLGLGSDERVSRLLRSFHRDKPRALKVCPPWDLQLVLQVLTGGSFEPIELVDMKFVTLKTAFLLAFASGSRRSEIHAWMKDGVSFSSKYTKVHLKACPTFLAKNQSASSAAMDFSPVVIPALAPMLEEGLLDITLCPVRALRCYLERTSKIRGDRVRLFISFKKGHKTEIQPQTISSWLKRVILLAYKEIKPEDAQMLNVKPHQVRSMAASWASLGGISTDAILRACHWKQHTTFTSYYLQPLAWRNGERFTLGPMVAAQNVINPAKQQKLNQQ